MEDDMKKKLIPGDSVDSEEIVVNNRITTQAEKEKKCLISIAERLIRTARVSPRSLMRNMNPLFPFSVTQVEREVLKIHRERKDKAKKFLKGFDGKLTLSYDRVAYDDDYDEWDDSYSRDGHVLHNSFVCVSVHFVDHNWNAKKWILGYSPIEFDRVEKVEVYRFKHVILDYEIEDKVSTVLVPNWGGVLGRERLDGFRKWIDKKGRNPVDPCFFRIYCCSDLFRLMAGDLFDNMDLLLEDIRLLVSWGKLTSTNWNVSLCNLQEALDMEDKKVFEEDEYYQDFDQPSDEEWIMIRTFCKLAGCIYKVAKELFEGGYSTASVYFHLLAELKSMLNEELKNGDNEYFLDKAKEIVERFDKYWNDTFLVLATASVLDPRFKMKFLEFYCSKKKDTDEGSKAETVLDYLRNLCAHYAASGIISPKTECRDATFDSLSYTSEEEEEEEESDSDEEEESDSDEEEQRKDKEEKKHDAYEGFGLFQEFLKFEGASREFDESELGSYLKEPVMEWNKDFKALEWWRVESRKYPILSRVARDVLSILISRATSYEAYVADQRECPEFVVTMKAKLVNAMMCSKQWSTL
ncbi:unnamed protein product [Microthlaspi erraticum]|uniref:HAT C-terminal dimerisation domain-containing protein n=1 Tax=Microthlaspi erraticum TaxID=1685480 RepID=A0A6D2HHL4_9BRAS|nr:unnamed protein product [Microthlaspi erraticum]